MERRILGRTGFKVTPLGFGSQTIGGLGYGDQDWDESQPTAAAYLAGGGRMQDERIDVMQFPYSFGRPEVGPLIAEAHRRGIGVVVRQALEGGMFTDKFRPGHVFTDRANDWRAGIDPERMQEVLTRIEAIRQRFVKPPYKTLAQVALAWVLADPHVSATIPGAGSVQEMRDNLTSDALPALTPAAAHDLAEMAQGLLEMMRQRK